MALKHWKKSLSGKTMIRWHHKDRIAEVEVETHYYPMMKRKYFSVNVTNVKPNNEGISAGYTRFNSKEDAIKHAREYMSKH